MKAVLIAVALLASSSSAARNAEYRFAVRLEMVAPLSANIIDLRATED